MVSILSTPPSQRHFRLHDFVNMATECYANNGSLYSNTAATYVPCDPTAVESGGHSSCCAIGDLCMSNGLCMEASNEPKGLNHYWRNGCTDKTWKDPACPNFCRGEGMSVERSRRMLAHMFTEEPNHYNAFIFYCYDPQNEFCCAPQGTLEAGVTSRNTSCCNDDELVFKADKPAVTGTALAVLPRISKFSSSSSSATSASTASSDSELISLTSATSARTTATMSITSVAAEASDSSGMTSGARAGLGVGVTLGILAVLAIVGVFLFKRRRKANPHGTAHLLSNSKANLPPYITYESAGTARAELDGTMLPAEMYHASDKTASTNIVSR